MSQRVSGYERRPNDLYETPEWVTEALLPHIMQRVDAPIWEPAAGNGKIANVLERIVPFVFQSDIQGEPGLVEELDFLTTNKIHCDFDFIITNPPYELAREFIVKALDMSYPSGLVAMLLRTDFDHAKTRQSLFGEHRAFAKKLVLTKRIKWFEGTTGSPSFNHAWFIWDWLHEGAPTIAYGPTAHRNDDRTERSPTAEVA